MGSRNLQNLVKIKYLEVIWKVRRQQVRQEYPRQSSGRYKQEVISAPWHLMLTCWGGSFFVIGGLLASIPWIEYLSPSVTKKKKNVSRHYQVTPWGQKSPPLRTTSPEKQTKKSCELHQVILNSPVHCGEGVNSQGLCQQGGHGDLDGVVLVLRLAGSRREELIFQSLR